MPRVSSTYKDTLECASALWTQGVWPSPTIIRRELGGGSYSTIGAALDDWRKTTGAQPPRTSRTMVPKFEHPTVTARQVEGPSERLPAPAAQELQAMQEALAAAISTLTSEISKMRDRLEAVQKHMLLSIEQARSETRLWKERVEESRAELAAWRQTMQGRQELDAREIRRLNALLEVHRGNPQRSVPTRNSPSNEPP